MNVIVGGSVKNHQGGKEFCTLKYSSNGGMIWTNYESGQKPQDEAIIKRIQTDQNNDVYSTGTLSACTKLPV